MKGWTKVNGKCVTLTSSLEPEKNQAKKVAVSAPLSVRQLFLVGDYLKPESSNLRSHVHSPSDQIPTEWENHLQVGVRDLQHRPEHNTLLPDNCSHNSMHSFILNHSSMCLAYKLIALSFYVHVIFRVNHTWYTGKLLQLEKVHFVKQTRNITQNEDLSSL